ncbi:chorismate mutase [bacterium]|nr:chorismate mutase [bacterium]
MTVPDLANDPLMIDMRRSIDHFDTAFLHLLAERMRIVRKIIALKQRQDIDLRQSDARKQDMKEIIEMSVQLKLERHFFKKILDLVFQDAITQYAQEDQTGSFQAPAMDFQSLSLPELRKSLLNLDKSLCFVLAERFCVVKRIGLYKESLNIPPLDPVRWQQVLDDKADASQKLGISVSLVKNIFNAIHEVALAIEEDIKIS